MKQMATRQYPPNTNDVQLSPPNAVRMLSEMTLKTALATVSFHGKSGSSHGRPLTATSVGHAPAKSIVNADQKATHGASNLYQSDTPRIASAKHATSRTPRYALPLPTNVARRAIRVVVIAMTTKKPILGGTSLKAQFLFRSHPTHSTRTKIHAPRVQMIHVTGFGLIIFFQIECMWAHSLQNKSTPAVAAVPTAAYQKNGCRSMTTSLVGFH